MKITNVFVGTVGQDPRAGSFEDGRAWANVRIAVNHDYFNGATGEVVSRGVSWFDVSAYGALARNLTYSVSKGDSIIVVGELRMRDWEKDGRTGTSGTIIADVIGPNLLFGVAKYVRSSTLTPDAPDGTVGDGEGTGSRGRAGGAWGNLPASSGSGAPQPGTGTDAGPGGGAGHVSPAPPVVAPPQVDGDRDDAAEPELAAVGAPAGDAHGSDEGDTGGADGPPF